MKSKLHFHASNCSARFVIIVKITTCFLLRQRHPKRPITLLPVNPTCQQAQHIWAQGESLGCCPEPTSIRSHRFGSTTLRSLFGINRSRMIHLDAQPSRSHSAIRRLQSLRQRLSPRTSTPATDHQRILRESQNRSHP